MKLLKLAGALSAIGFAVLAAPAAMAADPFVNPDWANSAWYVGGSAGATQATVDRARIESALRSNRSGVVDYQYDHNDKGYKVFLGKQLNRYLAIEAGYFDVGQFGFDAVTTDGRLSGTSSYRGVNLDLVGQVPMTERLSLLGRVGAAYTKTRTDFSGNRLNAVTGPHATQKKAGLKAGLGLEYKLSEALAVRTEYERYRVNDAVGNRGDVDALTFGLVYKLGRPVAQAPVYVPPAEPAPAPVVVETPPPPPPAPVPTSEKVSFAAEALFDFDKALVKPAGMAALDDLLMKLQGMNTEVMVTVGHTDSIGSDAYNQKLSQRRAEAVKAYIVSKGVDASRVYTEGKG